RVRRVGMPRALSTRKASPIMLARLSGSGWTWETKVTERTPARPARNWSESRVLGLPFTVGSALRRAMVGGPPQTRGMALLGAVQILPDCRGAAKPSRLSPRPQPLSLNGERGELGFTA